MAANKGDVLYYVPGKKKPIAYSTRAEADFLKVMTEDGYTTPNEIIKAIDSKYQLAFEERDIMEVYIKLGYGNLKLDLV